MQPKQTLTVDEIDLSDVEFWRLPLEEREGAFKTLRDQRPLPFYEEPDYGTGSIQIPKGPGYYAITKHAHILETSKHPDLFCSGQGATSVADMPPEFLEFFGSMINMDDPRHARLRRIVSAAFTPGRVKRIDEQIQEAATAIVDKLLAEGGGDFVTDVAARLPLNIICDLMGIPESDYDSVFHKSNVILGAADPEYVPEGEDIAVALLTAGQELTQMVSELGAYRADHPADDLTTALVTSNVDGEHLTNTELGSFFILLVVAGNETTRNAISHGLKLLTDNPDQRERWQSDVEKVTPTAVEEIVRVASPVMFMRRTVTRDTVLDGHDLKGGDKLLLFYWSANRDEDVFNDPYSFDVARDPNPHVGFGGPGPHFCLGAHLARREIAVMYKELFARAPSIRATGEPSRLLSSFINGIKHLPCEV